MAALSQFRSATPAAMSQAPDPSDHALVRAAQHGDRSAFGLLYARYARMVHGILLSRVPPCDAEDLVQDVFLQALPHLDSLREPAKFPGWLAAIARNRAIDYLRSVDGKMSAGALELDRAETPPLFSNFEDNALTLDRSRVLKTAFEKLTPTQKQVIELAYFEGLSQTEMAERMKQPLGTVKTWVRSALKAMRDDIAGEATEAAAVGSDQRQQERAEEDPQVGREDADRFVCVAVQGGMW